MDGDGDLDFLTSNQTDGTVSVALNTGAGTFTNAAAVVVDANLSCVTLGDVDGDGDLDMLTAHLDGLNIRFNDGTGAFSSPLGGAGTVSTGASSTPFRGGAGGVAVLLNDGTGTFSGSQSVVVPSTVAPSSARRMCI